MVSYLVYYDTLLQNATDIITKCFLQIRQVLHYKMRQLLQNTSILLQNAVQAAICRHTVKHL